MKKTIINYCLIIFVVVNNTGCSTVRIRTDKAQSATEESVAPKATVHRMFWGFLANSEYLVTETDCPSRALQQVHVKTTFLEGLVTVVTLGIYCPVDISWSCAKQATRVPVHN